MLLRAERHGMHGAISLNVQLASRNDHVLSCLRKWRHLRNCDCEQADQRGDAAENRLRGGPTLERKSEADDVLESSARASSN
jgi:hypothetical protein